MSLISDRQSGLPCRGDRKCNLVFYPASDHMDDLQHAIANRDRHEKDDHAYIHVQMPPPPQWDFSTPMTNRGRSMLRRRRNGDI